jgi:catechol 2,3-dioxygenase-like lactoylglutathione lyase family enzyme
MNRARDFYENVLGLPIMMDMGDQGSVAYACADGTILSLYSRPGHKPAGQTLAAWLVNNVEAEVEDLINRGVRFEQYDIPEIGLQTDDRGIAELGGSLGAWFTDPDGNILAVFEVPQM